MASSEGEMGAAARSRERRGRGQGRGALLVQGGRGGAGRGLVHVDASAESKGGWPRPGGGGMGATVSSQGGTLPPHGAARPRPPLPPAGTAEPFLEKTSERSRLAKAQGDRAAHLGQMCDICTSPIVTSEVCRSLAGSRCTAGSSVFCYLHLRPVHIHSWA